MSTKIQDAGSRFANEFSDIVSDAEDSLKRAGTETGERAIALRSEVETKLKNARIRLKEYEGEAITRAKAAASVTNQYVRDKPWQAMGVIAVVGVAIGLLLNRRH